MFSHSDTHAQRGVVPWKWKKETTISRTMYTVHASMFTQLRDYYNIINRFTNHDNIHFHILADQINQVLLLIMKCVLNPLSPHDALKHHLTSLKTDLVFYNQGFYNENFHETGLPIHGNFLIFLNHIKSSSFTTSRELRQQFTACSGWRWRW